jgi:HlyD family secretion protein
MTRLKYFACIAVAGVTLAGCVDRQAQQQAKKTAQIVTDPVQTVAVQAAHQESLSRTLEVTGDVTTSEDSEVGAKANGKMVAVYVNDGDMVRAGQVLATQDPTPLTAQLNQATAQVLSAQAGLAQAQSQLTQAIRNATINPYRSTFSVASARASLKAAEDNYKKMLAGARPQERRQAEATLNSAKANLDTQKKQLDRIRTLVQQGALAGSQLDQQQATYEGALATYQNAQQALDMIQQGNRQEDIDSARDQVNQAREALRTAQATKQLDPLYQDQVDAAKAAVASARAQIDNAKAQVVIAKQAIDDAVIRAPFDGQVSGKPIQVGTIAGPGTTIVRIIGKQGVYFEGNVPSDSISQIAKSQSVSVVIDALGGKSYPGRVAAINPLASTIGRLFTVRIQFVGAPPEVRPGMFARGIIEVEKIPNATVVPAVAVVSQGDSNYVFLADGSKAKRTPVELGLRQNTVVQVKNLPVGSQVIVQGQDRLSDGSQIKVQKDVSVTSNSQFGRSGA